MINTKMKRTNHKENPIFAKIMQGMYHRGSKLKVAYTGGNCVKTKLKKCDFQELSFFLLGLFLEIYRTADKDKVYKSAVSEVLDSIVKECKK